MNIRSFQCRARPHGFMATLGVALMLGGCASTQEWRPYSTDGCGLFPDGSGETCWADCCEEHDRAYWPGGTAHERQQSDELLRACAADHGQPSLADFMYLSVRLGGSPLWPTWYRWAYGGSYGRGYQPLTAQEQPQVEQALKETPP